MLSALQTNNFMNNHIWSKCIFLQFQYFIWKASAIYNFASQKKGKGGGYAHPLPPTPVSPGLIHKEHLFERMIRKLWIVSQKALRNTLKSSHDNNIPFQVVKLISLHHHQKWHLPPLCFLHRMSWCNPWKQFRTSDTSAWRSHLSTASSWSRWVYGWKNKV